MLHHSYGCVQTPRISWRVARQHIIVHYSREARLWQASLLQCSFDSTPSTWLLQWHSATGVWRQRPYYCNLTTALRRRHSNDSELESCKRAYYILGMQYSSCVRMYVCTRVEHIATAYARALTASHSGSHSQWETHNMARFTLCKVFRLDPNTGCLHCPTTSVRVSSTLFLSFHRRWWLHYTVT